MSQLVNPDQVFFDNTTGRPVANGTVYFGQPNQDPETDSKQPFSDLDLTTAIDATQTLTGAGKLPQRTYLSGAYSVRVREAGTGAIVFTDLYVEGVGKGDIDQAVVGRAFESIEALRLSVDNSSYGSVYCKSYSPGWAATVAGPKGGHYRHRTGGSNTSPSVGSAVAVSTIGTGTQAGYVWDADGVEWRISRQHLTPEMLGAAGGGTVDDYTAITDTYTVHHQYNIPMHLEDIYGLGTSFVVADDSTHILGGGKKRTGFKRLAGIDSADPTLSLTPGNFGIFKDFQVDNDNLAGDAIKLYLVNESTFYSVYVNNVSSGYAWTVQQSSSNSFHDCFSQNVDKILYLYQISNQCDFYDFGGAALSRTEAAVNIQNSFRTNFYGGLVEHDGRGLQIGSDIDGIKFSGTYIESLVTSAALSDVLIAETTGGNSNSVTFEDVYVTQNADKGAPNIEITGDARNIRIVGGQVTRSVAGTDDLIEVTGNAEFLTIEDLGTYTTSVCNVFNASGHTVKGLSIKNITDLNANSTIDVGNVNGCSLENLQPVVTVGASALRVSAQGMTSGAITDNSNKVRYLDSDGLNNFGQGVVCLEERSDPGSAPANNGYLFVQDNGAGKTQLAVRFPSGAIQVLSTEP